MLNRLLIVNLLAVSGYAADVCKTLPECQQLKTQLSASLPAVQARIQEVEARIQALRPSPQVGDIVRNNEGSILYMRQADAISYCKSQGQHLPSAREFAQLAQSQGAAGISEKAKPGYYQVNATNADGKADTFYFSSAGYNRPAGDLGKYTLWSSSINSNQGETEFLFFANSGDVYWDTNGYHTSDHAVLCARGQ